MVHRVERRINRKNTIGDMYNVMKSLDDVSFNHDERFDLIQAFPFASFNDKSKTLEEQKLFPNAVVHIRNNEDSYSRNYTLITCK